MVLRWIDQSSMERDPSWVDNEIVQVLWHISSAVDGTEDDAVWDDEEEEAEDTEERIDKEFETDSEAEDDE